MEIKDLLKKTRDELGLKIVVITDGREGSYSFDGNDYWKLPEYPGDRIEATGAGDAYATALCAALFYEKPLPEAMVWGSINGALVVGKVGPQAGLATLEVMDQKIKALLNFKAEKF